MKDISILIPTYNDDCSALVAELQRQAASLDISYEIIVADDGSTDAAVVTANREACQRPGCRMILGGENRGRAAIRNWLASEASYPWVLFIDGDLSVCRDDFLQRYAATGDDCDVVDGGIEIGECVAGNLRSLYEKAAEPQHTVSKRNLQPYHDFHTANFLIRRQLLTDHPFDIRFRHYGYEDVIFGKQLQQSGIAILHIDNPICFNHFESNASFVGKTEEALQTLYRFRSELQGYSRMLTHASRLAPMTPVIRLFHRIFGRWERHHLMGTRPTLFIFRLYRLGYYLSLR